MANKKAKGKRAKTRRKMKKGNEKVTVNKLLRKIDLGSTAQVNINSSVHSGLPFRRFQGLTGKVKEKRGNAYIVKLRDGGKWKEVIAHPAHLKILKEKVSGVE